MCHFSVIAVRPKQACYSAHGPRGENDSFQRVGDSPALIRYIRPWSLPKQPWKISKRKCTDLVREHCLSMAPESHPTWKGHWNSPCKRSAPVRSRQRNGAMNKMAANGRRTIVALSSIHFNFGSSETIVNGPMSKANQ